jgi:hypothetical protein
VTSRVIGWKEISEYIGSVREMEEWAPVLIGSPWERKKPLGTQTTTKRIILVYQKTVS